jgi:hypothetical protein
MAAECTVLPTLRDDKPTEQCMEKYRQEKMAAETVATTLLPKVELVDFDLMAGAVHVAVGAALLALA